MEPEYITLSERSQTPKATYRVISFMGNAQSRQISRHREQVNGGRRGERERGVSINGYRVSFWGDRNVLELNSEYTLNCTLQKGEFCVM